MVATAAASAAAMGPDAHWEAMAAAMLAPLLSLSRPAAAAVPAAVRLAEEASLLAEAEAALGGMAAGCEAIVDYEAKRVDGLRQEQVSLATFPSCSRSVISSARHEILKLRSRM